LWSDRTQTVCDETFADREAEPAVTDPLDLLRAANPIDDDRLLDPARSTTARALFEQITGSPYTPPPVRNPRRSWRLYVGTLVAASGIGGGVAWAVTMRHPDKVLTVACYQRSDLTDASVVASDGRNPVDVCRDAWRAGKVGPVTPTTLIACVLPGGTAGVFPGDNPNDNPNDNICERLGLTPAAPPTTSDQTAALTVVRDALSGQFQATCLPLDKATVVAQHELAAQHLNAWTVETPTPATPERPCASLAIDEPGHRIILVPIPKR
jgi:hypothetical protein